jgi:flagellar biosynthesis/type III secretory pathway protein FliH
MTVRRMSANEYERRVAEEADKRRRDAIGAINFARDEGLAEGMAKGLSKGVLKGKAEGLTEGLSKGVLKGKAETKADIVHRMKSNGVDTATLSQYTGIPVSEIDTILAVQ